MQGEIYPTEFRALPSGDAATFETLDAMRDAALIGLAPEYSGYTDAFNRKAAHAICAGRPNNGSELAQIAALFDYAQNQIAYVAHPLNQQTLQDAKRTMLIGSGDCVSLSVLLATLLAALDIKNTRYVAQWVDGSEASHVYVEVTTDGADLALDAVARSPMGWRQPLLEGGFESQLNLFK